MKKITLFLGLFLLTFNFLGCEKKADTGVHPVHYDRDMCARCAMVVSDRKNSVQMVDPKTSKSYMFDDIGCMILWVKQEHPELKDRTAVWVTAVNSGKWIDAKTAFYTTGNVTPMAFGFSAYESKDDIKDAKEIINYREVAKRVMERKI